ncbi:MaoC family dehydratase [Bacillus salipaludis]|uniref:MaoC family dehydratase n=1 Tax=Bacillus salipaludis TaxID=2547811 RepID=A0ABW8RQ03_9BACI
MSNKNLTNGWTNCRVEQPQRGATSEVIKEITLSDIELFSAMTGDRNPLHTDKRAAEASRFGGLIVQGGVTTGILNAIVAEQLPGPGTVFLTVEWKFANPVYIGDTITGKVEILEVRDDKPICKIKTTVRNQDDVICLEGIAVTYTAALDG